LSGEEDISLKILRLKKLRRMMAEASKQSVPEPPKPQEEPASSKLLRFLTDRGDEVLEAAKSLDPELVRAGGRGAPKGDR